MARPRSDHVATVKQKLVVRLEDGLFRGGDRFMSARTIAGQFGISYQTADRLLRELVAEGRLARRPGAGTYVSGRESRLTKVALVFNRRAGRAGSFGARLLSQIEGQLRSGGVEFVRTFVAPEKAARPPATHYPVLWEATATAADLVRSQRRGMLLNDRPPPGLGALRIDSVSVDDALGGTCAAELIGPRIGRPARVGVLAGPRDDVRSNLRIAGFVSRFPDARVVHTPTWFREDALAPAAALLARRPDAVFACNDRLAQAVLEAAAAAGRPTPVLFGFDDAPIAEALHLSTIAMPWQELAAAVASVAGGRLSGGPSGASHLLLSPRPIVRLT